MKRLWAIALNTFREAVRDRVFTSIIFFAVLVLLASQVVEEITIGDGAKMVRSLALAAIRGFGSIVAIFLGIQLVARELERKTVYTIASKPIPRWLFLLGKYLGLIGVLAVQVGAMGLLYTLLMLGLQDLPPPIVYVNWGLLLLELGLLTAWAVLFSTYSSSTLAAAFSLSIFVIGHLADDVWLYGNQARSESVRQVARALYWVLPNFSVLSLHDDAVYGRPVETQRVLTAAAYGLAYISSVLSASSLIFGKRDFK